MPSLPLHKTLCFLLCLFLHPAHANSSTTGVPQMVYVILSYAKWEQNTPNICIVNNPALAQQFNSQRSTQHVYKISPLQLDDLKQTSCQAIVFSNLSPREEQNILNNAVRYLALSISTTNSACELGSVFCLYQKKNQQYSFRVNMQSLTQSQVHIDPRVLLLGKNGGLKHE